MVLALVDDDGIWIKRAKSILQECADRLSITLELLCFQSGRELLSYTEKPVNAAFIDIELEEENGIKLASTINIQWPECQIVYCTDYIHYAMDVYGTKHSHFLTKARMEERNLRLQENINLARHFFDEVQEHADSIRHYRHDLNKHMRILEEFLEKGKKFDHSEEYRELSCSYQRMQKDAAAMYQNAYCDNDIINAICEINQRECQKRDIIFETDISGDENAWKKLDWISEYHLTGILMNLLDNAREAQLRLEPGERKFIFLLVHLTPASDMTPERHCLTVAATLIGS